MRKILSLLSLVLVLNTLSYGQVDQEAKKILDAINAKYKTHTSFQANVTYKLEVTSNPTLNETFSADLKVKGDKFHLKKSDGEEFYCDGKYVWNVISSDKEAYVSDFNKEDKLVDFSSVLDAYKTGYKYVKLADETLDGVKCTVIDLNPDKSAGEMAKSDVYKIRLLINPKTNEVMQWIVFEKNGNRHKFKINSYKPNVAFTDATFTYNYKSHPEIIVEDLTEEEAFSK